MAQAMPQPLAQFADVTLDDILVDVLTEEAVDGIEDLGLRHPAARVVHEILEDAALTARQRQHLAPHFRIAAIGEHPEIADHGAFGPTPCTCADGLDPGQDFAHVDRLADDIVHARSKQIQGLFQRLVVVHGDDCGARSAFDQPWQQVTLAAVAQQKCLDR